jgi:hypothetical protein
MRFLAAACAFRIAWHSVQRLALASELFEGGLGILIHRSGLERWDMVRGIDNIGICGIPQ